MKKTLLAASILLVAFCSFSQEIPVGFNTDAESFSRIQTVELATFDHAVLLAEDKRTEELGGRSNFGRIIPSDMNATNSGEWTQLDNGDLIWRLRFRTADAKGVCVYFKDLFLPIGSSLYLYPADRHNFVGPFTNEDCNDHGHFMAGEVTGDEAILEYYQPAAVVGEARLGLHGIAHLYRFVYEEEAQRGGGSEACEVDVNCPEGDGWEHERDAVVRLQIVSNSEVGLCSGSLVNTTAMDCRRYILTAMHCGEDISDADWLLCAVRFKYQRAQCSSGSTPSTNNKVGVYHLADSNDGGGATGSDFLLLEMEDEIPSEWTPFFAGWDASATTPQTGKGIHHPAGDRKKVSTTDDIISGTYNATGYHWRVKWMETETNWGVTEGGSSGSPLFDQNHHLVGTLTGGLSFCDTPTGSDYYGKFSKHWSANPNNANQKLRVWLDPEDTGTTVMSGSYVGTGATPCEPTLPISVSENITFNDVLIYPSVADRQLNINCEKFRDISEVRIFNSAGALLEVFTMATNQKSVETTGLAVGIYYISVLQENGNFVTKKFAVAH